MTAPTVSLPILTQVQYAIQHGVPCLVDLRHVQQLVSEYLDASVLLNPVDAVARGSTILLDRVLLRVINDPSLDEAVVSHWLAHAMEIAIKQNSLASVQQIHRVHPEQLNLYSLRLALENATLPLVEWVVANRHDRLCCPPGLANLCRACLTQSLPFRCGESHDAVPVVEWLLAIGVESRRGLFHHFRGNIHFLRWLVKRHALGSLDETSLLSHAFERETTKCLEIVTLVISHWGAMSEQVVVDALVSASCQARLEPVVDAIVTSHLCDSFRDAFVWASIRPGGPKVLQWCAPDQLRANVQDLIPTLPTIAASAAQWCRVDTLQWLWQERETPPPSGIAYRTPACESDLLTLYEWLLETGLDGWCTHDTTCAAQNGFLSIVQWLHRHQPHRLTVQTVRAAIVNGHLQVLQWLHENRTDGIPAQALELAAQPGHVGIVQWLSIVCGDANPNEALFAAALSGHLDLVVWLHANRVDCCTSCVLDRLLSQGSSVTKAFDAIRWLTRHAARRVGCARHCVSRGPQLLRVVSPAGTALNRGDVAFARYIFEHHRATFDVELPNPSFAHAHLRALQWLHATAPASVDWNRLYQWAREQRKPTITEWLQRVATASEGAY